MPTMGALSRCPPVDPRTLAEPNENTPPSDATAQYPCCPLTCTPPTIGRLSGLPSIDPKNGTPKVKMPPSDAISV